MVILLNYTDNIGGYYCRDDHSFSKQGALWFLMTLMSRKKMRIGCLKTWIRVRMLRIIAKSCRIDEELAERICRMYLTHPGIDIDGIITRISWKVIFVVEDTLLFYPLVWKSVSIHYTPSHLSAYMTYITHILLRPYCHQLKAFGITRVFLGRI